jgi:hypothetical protein
VPGWQGIDVDTAEASVRLPPGVALDLGATAKALAADRAAFRAAAATGGGVMVSLGGDVAVAGEPPAGGWTVELAEDHRDGSLRGETRRGRHLLYHRPALDRRGRGRPSHHRPSDRRAGRRALAHGHRRGRKLDRR